MTTVLIAALLSGLFQALGYLIYIRKSLRNEVNPNPTTWLMFAYGTATLTLLELATVEWDLEGNFLIFILPITCAILSLRVAAICWSKGTLQWPKKPLERIAILMDLALTVAYAVVWMQGEYGNVSEEMKQSLTLAFLVLTNVSAVICFIPIVHETWEDPSGEHPLPWSIWFLAYCMLGYVTYIEHGLKSELMIYPVSNVLLHGLMALLATRKSAASRASDS